MRISDWSSDVCSSDLLKVHGSRSRKRGSAGKQVEAALHVQHGQAGLRRILALVLAVDGGARPGLLTVLAGEDAIAERQGVLAGEILQLAGAFAADVVVEIGRASCRERVCKYG